MPDLSMTALQYAAGELDPIAEAAFEMRLADDRQAQEILSEAVRLSAVAAGQAEPTADPIVKSMIVDRLNPSWCGKLFSRRSYHGHPIAWSAIGALIAIGVVGSSGVFDQQIVVKESSIQLPESQFAITPKDSDPMNPMGGGDNDARGHNRPATFLPEAPRIDPVGIGDG